MNPDQSIYSILIVIVPLLTSFCIPIIGAWKKRLCYPLVNLAVLISLFASIKIAVLVIQHGPIHYFLGGWKPPWGIAYYIDHLNALMAVLISFLFLLVAMFSKESIPKELPLKEVPFYVLFLLLFTGLLGIILTGDMFNLYVFLEVASLSAYALIALGEKDALYASYRYLII